MLKQKIKRIINKVLYYKAEFIWGRHISKVYKHLGIKKGNVNTELINKHQNYWKQLKDDVNPKWFQVYTSITDKPDIHYVPENIYFNIIEEKLNNRRLAIAYGDKNLYETFYSEKEIFPETIIRYIDGVFYSNDYKLLHFMEESFQNYLTTFTKFLIKPSTDSGGGKKIELFSKIDNYFVSSESEKLTLNYLKKNFEDNFIIQNYLKQSDHLSKFNSTSVNTIRVFTYRSVKTDEVFPLHAVLRIGKKGNFIDDQNVGGVACKINEDNYLNKYATDMYGKKYYSYNDIVFAEMEKVPQIDKMKKYAAELAKKNIHSRVIGFDFTIDNNEQVKLIETNHLWGGINFFQMNGSSVFGKYTDEVVEFCKNN